MSITNKEKCYGWKRKVLVKEDEHHFGHTSFSLSPSCCFNWSLSCFCNSICNCKSSLSYMMTLKRNQNDVFKYLFKIIHREPLMSYCLIIFDDSRFTLCAAPTLLYLFVITVGYVSSSTLAVMDKLKIFDIMFQNNSFLLSLQKK